MPINPNHTRGFTLIEMIAFIVVVGVSVVAIGNVFQHAVVNIQDPLINSQLIGMAQSQLDETLSRQYDENTPTGGIPACGTLATTCAGIGLESGETITNIATLDDIDDFNGYQDIPQTGYSRAVSVVYAGTDFGTSNHHAKRITVTVTAPQGQSIQLSVYRFNF
jgi:MSHA pilin protein MshD